jgi:hypothetical protein
VNSRKRDFLQLAVHKDVDDSILQEASRGVGSGPKEGFRSKRGAFGKWGEFFISWLNIYIIHIIRRIFFKDANLHVSTGANTRTCQAAP